MATLKVSLRDDRYHPDLRPEMRSTLLSWVREFFNMKSRDAFHLSAWVLDTVLSRKTVQRDRLQLLGVTCAMVATKFLYIKWGTVSFYCHRGAGAYTRDEILTMEPFVLNVIDWGLHSACEDLPYVHNHARIQSLRLGEGESRRLENMSSLLSDTVSLYENTRFSNAELSLAVVLLACEIEGVDASTVREGMEGRDTFLLQWFVRSCAFVTFCGEKDWKQWFQTLYSGDAPRIRKCLAFAASEQ